jgi:dTDP-4-dehydrorhamnose reductase
MKPHAPSATWTALDVDSCTQSSLADLLKHYDWVINAIGVIKPYIHDDNAVEVERAIRVNAQFPYILAHAAQATGCRVIQIATDCVFSGALGSYGESAPHDALDAYGKTKSLGEVRSSMVFHLRCSIVGPEPRAHVSLLDWFLRQPTHSQLNGYTNHSWNGITTLHFARLCHGIMAADMDPRPLHHVIPADVVSKAHLLEQFARAYGRADVTIVPADAKVRVDRTLTTEDADVNAQLWKAAGYVTPPSVQQMVAELASWPFRFSESK